MQPCVLSLVDNTHTTAAELLYDAVVRDGLSDHAGKCLACGSLHLTDAAYASQRMTARARAAESRPALGAGV